MESLDFEKTCFVVKYILSLCSIVICIYNIVQKERREKADNKLLLYSAGNS